MTDTKQDEMKERILRGEQALKSEPRKMSEEEIKAELQARLDSELDSYVSDSLRLQRLAETTTKVGQKP